MNVKDLREILKGVSGNAVIETGNSTAYYGKMERTPEVLNINVENNTTVEHQQTQYALTTINSIPKRKIKKVVLWCPE
jgi:hypothetical protein